MILKIINHLNTELKAKWQKSKINWVSRWQVNQLIPTAYTVNSAGYSLYIHYIFTVTCITVLRRYNSVRSGILWTIKNAIKMLVLTSRLWKHKTPFNNCGHFPKFDDRHEFLGCKNPWDTTFSVVVECLKSREMCPFINL